MFSSESQGGPNIALITIICSWIFLFIALLGIIILLWSRRIRKVGLDLGDYLTILALATTIALAAQTTWAIVDEGQDQHQAELSNKKLTVVVRSLLVNQTLWGVVNTFVRMSAILFIEKVFRPSLGIFFTRSMLVLSILYGLVVILEVFLICRPLAVDWNPHVDGKCADQIVSYLVLEILGLLIDFTVLVTPVPLILRLQFDWRSKMLILTMFSMGALVFIVTGLRIQALHMVNAQDFTYSKGYLGLLSALGASLGITFCCAPAVPLVYPQWRSMLLERASRFIHVNERSTAVTSGIPNAISSPTNEDNAAHTHRGSAIWRIFEYRHFKAYFKRAPKAVTTDEKETAAAFEVPYKIPCPVTSGCPVCY